MNKKIQSQVLKDIDAKKEGMLLHQILEEHVEKDKKHYAPCQDCIRLGINKGSQLQKAEFRKMIEDVDLELFLTDIKDKKGKNFEFSEEFMKIVEIWWNGKSKELLAKLGDSHGQKICPRTPSRDTSKGCGKSIKKEVT